MSVLPPLHTAWGGGLAPSPWVRGTWASLWRQLLQSPGPGHPEPPPLLCLPHPVAKPPRGMRSGPLCWQSWESDCLYPVEVGLCLLGELAVGV